MAVDTGRSIFRDIAGLLQGNLGWAIVAFVGLLFLGAYGAAVRYGTGNDPISRTGTAIGIVALDLQDIVEETIDLSYAILVAVGVVGGSILWVGLPLTQLDPVAWVTALAAAVGSGTALNVVQDPIIVLGALLLLYAVGGLAVVASRRNES